MKSRLIFTLLLCLSITGFAQKSSINFVIRNLGVNVDGHFNSFTIDAEIDANAGLKSLTGNITASSIKTGIDSRDEHLLEDDYFDVKTYKNITLKSTDITKKSSNKYTVKAKLTIKGKVKTITIPITVEKVNDAFKLTSAFEINRKDFNVGGSSFVMSKTVKINVIHYQKL